MPTVPSGGRNVTGQLVPRNPLFITFADTVDRFEVRNTGPNALCVIGSGDVPPGASRVVPNGQGWVISHETGSSLALSATGPTSFAVSVV